MARLVISNGPDKGREYTLDDSQTVGRLADNAITIVDNRLSRKNTSIKSENGQWVIEDLNSKNGTFLNNESITQRLLSDGDEIRLGDTWLTFFRDETHPTTPSGMRLATEDTVRDVSSAVQDTQSLADRTGGDNTQTSMAFLRQDLNQRDGTFRILILIGGALIMVGVFYLIQVLMVAD